MPAPLLALTVSFWREWCPTSTAWLVLTAVVCTSRGVSCSLYAPETRVFLYPSLGSFMSPLTSVGVLVGLWLYFNILTVLMKPRERGRFFIPMWVPHATIQVCAGRKGGLSLGAGEDLRIRWSPIMLAKSSKMGETHPAPAGGAMAFPFQKQQSVDRVESEDLSETRVHRTLAAGLDRSQVTKQGQGMAQALECR